MKQTSHRALVRTLEKQTEILVTLADDEIALQNAVLDRNWPAAEMSISNMSALATQFEQLESERRKRYADLLSTLGICGEAPRGETPHGETPFARILARMSDEPRRELTDVHRRLKVALLRVRSLSEGLDVFVATLVATTRSVLEELYPSRKGRLYGKCGRVNAPEDWALVVNEHL